MACRQVKTRKFAEKAALPIFPMELARRGGKHFFLPRDKIIVVDRQRAQRRRQASLLRLIQYPQFSSQYFDSPKVSSDVVHVEQQNVIRGRLREEPDSQ